MNKKLQEAIQAAKETLKGLELDEAEKQIAFSKAIDFYLQMDPPAMKEKVFSTAKPISSLPKDKNNNETGVDFWSNLSRVAEVEISNLKDVFSFKEDIVGLVVSQVSGGTRPEQQVNFASLILYGYTAGLNQEWVKAPVLAEAAKTFSLYDSNFSKILSKSVSFRKTGVGKGLQYKLTVPAIKKVQKDLKELSSVR